METKNNYLVTGLLVLIVGVFAGYLLGGNNQKYATVPANMHMMPNGELMQNSNTMSMEDMMISMNYELQGKTGDEFDQAFLKEMIVHHQGAVEMAQLALKNAKHQEIKDLATAIISAQNKEIADMKSWLKNWYNK